MNWLNDLDKIKKNKKSNDFLVIDNMLKRVLDFGEQQQNGTNICFHGIKVEQ